MVTIIHDVPDISRVTAYHEKKVLEGAAECLLAENLPMDAHSLGVYRRSQLMKQSCSLNAKIKVPCLHAIIGLHPLDARIGSNGYTKLVKKFMSVIGYGSQPYLAYEHRDTYHPHIHLVCSKINQNSRRLIAYTALKHWVFPEIRRLERSMGLVPAVKCVTEKIAVPERLLETEQDQHPLAERLRDVTGYLSDKYKYTELEELNALLGLYGIRAVSFKKSNKGSEAKLYYRNISCQIKSCAVISGEKLLGATHSAARLPRVNSELAEPVRNRIRTLLQMANRGQNNEADLRFLRSNALEAILDQKSGKITIIDPHSLHAVNQTKLGLDDLLWNKLVRTLNQQKTQSLEQIQLKEIINIHHSVARSL